MQSIPQSVLTFAAGRSGHQYPMPMAFALEPSNRMAIYKPHVHVYTSVHAPGCLCQTRNGVKPQEDTCGPRTTSPHATFRCVWRSRRTSCRVKRLRSNGGRSSCHFGSRGSQVRATPSLSCVQAPLLSVTSLNLSTPTPAHLHPHAYTPHCVAILKDHYNRGGVLFLPLHRLLIISLLPSGAIKARRKQEIDADIASKLARARAATTPAAQLTFAPSPKGAM